ncbi:MAG: S-layer homology domain-containing protein [Bacillota bacterium]|nr:S-layer homology domain-containing protein [Bacillota bacterium]
MKRLQGWPAGLVIFLVSLLLVVLGGAAGSCLAAEVSFKDAPPADHWAAQAVAETGEAKILIGYPDGTFRGDQAATRYELSMALSRLYRLVRGVMDRETVDPQALGQLADEVQKVRTLLAQMEGRVDGLDGRVNGLDERSGVLAVRVETLENRLVALEGRLIGLADTALEAVRQEVAQTAGRLAQLVDDLAEMRRADEGLATQVTELRRTDEDLAARMTELRQTVDRLGAELAELKRADDLRLRLQALEGENQKLKQGMRRMGWFMALGAVVLAAL